MDFYIGWSRSDAHFCNYFSDCPMLISAVPGNNRPLRKFKQAPSKLIVDSGALYYSSKHTTPLRAIFAKQLEIIADAPETLPITMVHVDQPLFLKRTSSEQFEAMEQTIYNAYEYKQLFDAIGFASSVHLMGVIQAFDFRSMEYCIHQMKKIGYTFFGIGSLRVRNSLQQMKFIEQAASLVGADNLHVFGVTGIPQIHKMVELGVASFDSTRPTMTAAYYQVFYSNPFRTYVLDDSRVEHKRQRIRIPLPCDCPVCVDRPEDILISSPRHYMKLRSIHNYYHLSKTIRQIQLEKAGQALSCERPLGGHQGV